MVAENIHCRFFPPSQLAELPLPRRGQVRLLERRGPLRAGAVAEALPVRGGPAGHQRLRGGAAYQALARQDHGRR